MSCHVPVLRERERGCMERSSSVVECRTPNQGSPGSNPPLLGTVLKFGQFCSLHAAPVHSAV